MNKTNQIPYAWEEIEADVREAVLCQVSVAEVTGRAARGLTGTMLGLHDPGDTLNDPTQTLEEEEQGRIPLVEFGLHRLARHAYLYAYQLDGADDASSDDAYEIACAVLAGFPATDRHGNPSPLSERRDAPLRRMFETFMARWALNEDSHGLTIRELALLANMTVPAVRTSLSKEGFKLNFPVGGADVGARDDDQVATLSIVDARLWLTRRRGFIPNRSNLGHGHDQIITAIFCDTDLSLPRIVQRMLLLRNVDVDETSRQCGIRKEWLVGLVDGKQVEIDVVALRILAGFLSIPEAEFVARAVRHLIEQELLAA